MKKSFLCIYILLYMFSLVVLETFLDVDALFYCALFLGMIGFLEQVAALTSYLTYKVTYYYNIQKDFGNIKQVVSLLFKSIFGLSLIGFFVYFLLSKELSIFITNDSSLQKLLQVSSNVILYMPLIGLFRGILYTFNRKDIVNVSYFLSSSLSFILILVINLVCHFANINDLSTSYSLILAISFLYLVIFIYLLRQSIDVFKSNIAKKLNLKYSKEKKDVLIKRIKTYSFPLVFVVLLLFMQLDIFYGKTLLEMGMNINDVRKFDLMTVFIGPLLNVTFMVLFSLFYDKFNINKDSVITFLIDSLKISLPFSIFVSLVYNYYPIYKYFVCLISVQIICLIILLFLYKENKKKIIFNTLFISLFIKEFLNVILLHSFKYTGMFTYNALITSSIITYLLIFIILCGYSVSKFKLDGEHLVKSLFDIITNLVFSVSIVLVLKYIIYFDNIFFGIIYIIIGMFLYLAIPKIIKRL